MNTSFRRTLKTLTAAAAAAGIIAAGATAASAHVSVDPDDTAANGYSHLTFNVPNESPTAKTNKLEVTLPTDTSFTSVSVKPVEGWTAQVVTGDLPKPVTVAGATVTKAPVSVVWTADEAHQLGQNQYQSFSLSVGRLPAAGTKVTLKAAQSYTDGSVVKWDEESAEGQPEPKHPAPSFVTTADDDAAAAGASAAPSAEAVSETKQASSDGTAVWGVVLGAAGFVLGAAALGLVLAGRQTRTAGK
ncbi:YcnI family copper-binding membrane protein [Pseudarthrobacter phenanthrenivorans]|uniref:Nuclear export factor GLE1 n=1 Tax=Pseudarthrobacter phenanthrenivorans TaxID=361575 RepID=A0A0B4DRV1_PSEPS|nr:YcnI family protein [Pseudarthrobacter phenanthrenivorans]KIC69426.1 nuclear export factor GLE1 [Pseudarthrobacter phenanthrenivorans]